MTMMALAFFMVAAQPAEAPARFALVIGVNTSAEPNLPALRYADDDAARWFDLLRSLGAHALVLMEPDDDTRRLHPQAAAEAHATDERSFDRAVAVLAEDVARAKAVGYKTELQLVYAGHGTKSGDEGFLTLKDGRIGAARLFAAVEQIAAERSHVIVDACYSYFLAYGRGPGGRARPLTGFLEHERLGSSGPIGLLLSTSTTSRSHEWAEYQAGIFSHEVRSGLMGAADADLDGLISYREIAAFVERANAPIANERFRPKVYARAPDGNEVLADLRRPFERRIEIDPDQSGRYFLEDERGVRLADFHSASTSSVRLWKAPGRTWLHRVGGADEVELAIDPAADVVNVASIVPGEARVRARGAEQQAFSQLFQQPFNADAVSAWRQASLEDLVVEVEPQSSPFISPWFIGGTITAGVGLIGTAGFGVGAAVAYDVSQDPAYFHTERVFAAAVSRVFIAATVASAALVVGGTASASVPFLADD
jgi:hypothetical protein